MGASCRDRSRVDRAGPGVPRRAAGVRGRGGRRCGDPGALAARVGAAAAGRPGVVPLRVAEGAVRRLGRPTGREGARLRADVAGPVAGRARERRARPAGLLRRRQRRRPAAVRARRRRRRAGVMTSVQRLLLGSFVRPAEETGTGAPRVEGVYGYLVRHPDGLVLLDTGIGRGDEETEQWYRPRRVPLPQALASAGASLDDL